jgi:hypothetical protein
VIRVTFRPGRRIVSVGAPGSLDARGTSRARTARTVDVPSTPELVAADAHHARALA